MYCKTMAFLERLYFWSYLGLYWNEKLVINFIPGTETKLWLQLLRQNVGSCLLMAIKRQNNRHTTLPRTHIAFIMPHPKGIGSRHKSWTGNNQGRQRNNPCDNWWFNCKEIHSKSNDLSSPVIYVPPQFISSVINPPQLSLVRQQSSRSSQNSTSDNRWDNRRTVTNLCTHYQDVKSCTTVD